MGKNYFTYTTEDFLMDIEFVRWVNTNGDHSDVWDLFLSNHVPNQEEFNSALKIIRAGKDKEQSLSKQEISSIWTVLNSEHEETSKPTTKYRFLKLTASVLVIISLGITAIYLSQSIKYKQQFETLNSIEKNEQPLLVMSNGVSVELQDKADIIYNNAKKEITINSEQVIKEELSDKKINQTALNKLIVPTGMSTRIQLADGSVVWLNSGSKFLYPSCFNGKTREVYLLGEGLFDVAKNEESPFIVKTEKLDIEVLGTRFNVATYHTQGITETVLVEGSVKLSEKSLNPFSENSLILSPNQKADFKVDNGEFSVNAVDVEMYTCWSQGILKFESELLETVIKKVSRYYGVNFSIDSNLLNKHSITGKLDLKKSLDNVLKVIVELACRDQQQQ